jgi:hypothetical protein
MKCGSRRESNPEVRIRGIFPLLNIAQNEP